MDFKQLRAFLTVADTGNVTRAADLLHLVQPAVSRQLRLLEEDVGVALFQRERHGMVLTEAGQALQGYARRVMLELERARAEMGSGVQGLGGLVTLGLLPSTIETLASPLVQALELAHPGIRLRIAMGYAGTLVRWLRSGEVDAALLYGAEQSPDIATTPLIEEPLWVIGLPAENLRPSKAVRLSALAGRPIVLPSSPHGIRTLVDLACVRANVELTLSVETNALSVQRSLVLGGHGLTILPPTAVKDDLESGKVCGAPLREPPITRTIVLAMPSNKAIGPHVRATVEQLIEVARATIDSGRWLEGHWVHR